MGACCSSNVAADSDVVRPSSNPARCSPLHQCKGAPEIPVKSRRCSGTWKDLAQASKLDAFLSTDGCVLLWASEAMSSSRLLPPQSAAPEGAPGPCTAMDIPDDTNSTRTSTSPLAYLLGDSHDVQAVLQEVHTTGFWSGRVKHSGCVLPAPPAATCHPAAAAAAHASEDPFSSGHPQCQSFALANSSALLTTGGTFMTGAPTRGRGNSTFQLLQLSLHSTAHAAPQIPGSSILSGTTIGMHTDTGSGFFSSSITWSTSGRAPAKPGKKLRRASTCLDGALDMAEAPRTQALLNSRLNTLTPGTRSSGAKKHAPTRSRHAPKQGGGLHKGRVKGGRQPPHLEQPKHERSQAGTHSEVHARGVRLRGAAHPRMSIDVRRMSVEVWRAPRAIPAKRHAGVDVAHGLHGASAAAQAVEAAAVGHAHAAAAGTDGPAGATVEGAATKAGRCTAVQQQEQHAWAGSTGSSATLDCSVFGSNCVHSQSMLAAGAEGGAPDGQTILQVDIRAVTDPATQQPVLHVSVQDVSARAATEALLLELTEGQLDMVCQMFPRHILDHCTGAAAAPGAAAGMASAGGQQQAGAAAAPDITDLARSHENVTLLFMDISGFTAMCKVLAARQVMGFLNALFSIFDQLVDVHGVHKVETAGDCYIVSAGVVEQGPDGFLHVQEHHDPADSARRVMAFAKDMLAAARSVPMPHTGQPTTVRVGLHTGPCTSGLIGSKLPKFSIFGDSMNTASRMESTAPVGRIQVSKTTYEMLQGEQ